MASRLMQYAVMVIDHSIPPIVYCADMTPASTIAFTIYLLATVAISVAITLARGWRVGVAWMFAVALLIIAWIDPHSPFASKPTVSLLVDASPSTRGFWFRDIGAVRSIATRLRAFTEVRAFAFAEGRAIALDLNQDIQEIDADESTLPTTQDDAIVLLSDGQFTASADARPCLRSLMKAVRTMRGSSTQRTSRHTLRANRQRRCAARSDLAGWDA